MITRLPYTSVADARSDLKKSLAGQSQQQQQQQQVVCPVSIEQQQQQQQQM